MDMKTSIYASANDVLEALEDAKAQIEHMAKQMSNKTRRLTAPTTFATIHKLNNVISDLKHGKVQL